MSDPYYPYGNNPNYQGGYRNNSYGNNQGNGSRYMQYPQGQSRRDYDNRQWNNSPQPQQWQASPYQQRGGYYDNSGYMRQDDRRNRQGDNRGHDYRGHDNRGQHNHSSSKYHDSDYQPSTQRPSIFQTTAETHLPPVIAPPAMTYDTPEDSAMEHSGRGEEYKGNQSSLVHEARVEDTYQQDQGHTEETYQPEERANEETYLQDERANDENYQQEEAAGTTERYERDVGCQKDDMISDISDAENPPDDTVLGSTEHEDDDTVNNQSMEYAAEDGAKNPPENSEMQEDRGLQADYEDNPEEGNNAGDQDEQDTETADQENQDDNVSEAANNDEDDAADQKNQGDNVSEAANNDEDDTADQKNQDDNVSEAASNDEDDAVDQENQDDNVSELADNDEEDAADQENQDDNVSEAANNDEDDAADQENQDDNVSDTANIDEDNAADQENQGDNVSEAANNDEDDAADQENQDDNVSEAANNNEDNAIEEQTNDENPEGSEKEQQQENENAMDGSDDIVDTDANQDETTHNKPAPNEEIPEQDAEENVDANEFAEKIIDENIGEGSGEKDDVVETEEKGTEDQETNEDATAEKAQDVGATNEDNAEDTTGAGAENAEAEKESNKATDDAPDKEPEAESGGQEGTEEGRGETPAEKEPDPSPEVEETDKNNDSSNDIVVTGEELGRSKRRRGAAEQPEVEEVDKDNDSSNDLVVTGVELGRPRRKRAAAERHEVVEVDKDNDSSNDVVVTGEESGRPRRRRAAAEQSQPVVLGTVQSTTISAADSETAGDAQNDDGAGFRIKQEGAQPVTKWVVGADGNLVRMSEDEFSNGAPWTQLSFNQPAEGELEPPQGGYLIQIEDLRVGEETHEDVSDFLNIPEEAVELWRSSKKCPVSQCKGPALTLKHFFDWHWYVFHEQLIKVYYCPVSGCTRMKERWNTRRKRDLIAHLQQKHCVEQFPEAIETQIINNPNYKPPTNFVTLPRAAPKPKPPPAAAKKAPAPARKRAADVLSSVQGVQSEVVDEQTPAEYEEAWKRLRFCPCVGCSKEKMFASEMKRHWKGRHVRYTTVYVCPDGDCQVKGRAKGQLLQFRTRDLSAMIKHLTSPAHLLTQTEAQQIGASLVPTQLDNPSYIEPNLCPIKMAPPEPAAKKPKTVSKAAPVEKAPVDVNAPRASRTGRTPRAESPVVKAEASPAAGGRRSRALNRVSQEMSTNSTPSTSDTESLPDSRKRSRHQRGNTDTPQEEPPTKRNRRDNNPEPQLQIAKNDRSGKFMTMVELDQFENTREEIIPNEYMEWWADRNGCPSTVCSASVCHFRIADLIRHWKLRHLKKVPQYYCPIVSCDYNVKHKPSLKKHLASRHNTTPGAIDSIIAKSKAELIDNSDFETPIHPNKTKSPAKSPARPKATNPGGGEKAAPRQSPAPPPEVVSRSRSGKIINTPARSTPRPGPKSRTMRSTGPAEEVSPISAEVVIALPRVDAPTPVRSGRRSTNRRATPSSSGKSLEQLAWQPTVNIMALPKAFTTSETVDVRSRACRSLLSSEKKKPPPQQKKLSPVKQSAGKAGPASAKSKAVMPDVRFEADDDDNDSDNFGIDVPMPSMEDAGIAVSFFPHKSPGGKHSPGKKGTPASSSSFLQSPGTDNVNDYRAALQALRERQMELERRLEGSGQPAVNSDVVKKISDLQAQNEALRFQNEALRKQLKSGAMAKQWEEEKKDLQQQVHNKDITINTLQDVISRMGPTTSTSNNITNQMINLPGSRPNTRGSQNALPAPPGRMSITPRAGMSRDGNFQQCSVALKSGAKVNFEYENFGDFMQKIGTLNDQYGLNE